MSIITILNRLQANYPKIKLIFLQTESSLQQILGQKQTTIKPTTIEINYNPKTDLETQLQANEIKIKDILGLVYKVQNNLNGELELYFVSKNTDKKPKPTDTWINIEEVENNYNGTSLEIASLYALGYLNCVRDGDETNFYPID